VHVNEPNECAVVHVNVLLLLLVLLLMLVLGNMQGGKSEIPRLRSE
jgi:hypothetical protein